MKQAPFGKLALAIALLSMGSLSQAAPVLEGGEPALSKEMLLAQTNAWVEIDSKAFAHNIGQLKSHLGGKAQICAVMKADAYGHSIALLMPTIIAQGINCVGVTSNEEARVARAKGFKGRLMRLRSATPSEIETALSYEMDELVGNLEVARSISELAQRKGRTINIHLGLNAGGMDRNGLEVATEQGKKDALALVKLPGIKLAGIMTHFPYEERDKVLEGFGRFKEQTDWLIKKAKLNRKDLILHCANSFTTLNVPEAWMDMVRPGAALYEPLYDAHPGYARVMQFKSRVASVNAYPAGSTVGYDGTHTLNRDSLLANIPLGYSDGYRRVFSNQVNVLINGQRAPSVGRVSMNTFMVDVTDIGGVKPGDEVVLFGKQGNDEITQGELEEALDLWIGNAYVLWSNSNPRVLKED